MEASQSLVLPPEFQSASTAGRRSELRAARVGGWELGAADSQRAPRRGVSGGLSTTTKTSTQTTVFRAPTRTGSTMVMGLFEQHYSTSTRVRVLVLVLVLVLSTLVLVLVLEYCKY